MGMQGFPRKDSKLAGHKLIMAEAMYWLCGYSTTEVGNFFGICAPGIRHLFRSYGVSLRSRAEGIKLIAKAGRMPYHGLKQGKHPFWKGGHSHNGPYPTLLIPDHPRADKKGYVKEHILVMETKLGRPLEGTEEVHHDNRIKTDNRPENLILVPNHSEHMRIYHQYRRNYFMIRYRPKYLSITTA